MKLGEALKLVHGGGQLSRDEASVVFGVVLAGEADPVQLGGFLIALAKRRESVAEIQGAADAMRAAMTPLEHDFDDAIDTCGTGGSGLDSFNLSTAAGIVAAAAGARVVKHGNRNITSRCGSADLLEAAGIPLELSPTASRKVLEEVGITFLFAPRYHAAMRHAGPVRKSLGVRTIFNLLGPLCNPGGVKRQLLGVSDVTRLEDFAEVLHGLGTRAALVVHGAGGADELTLAGENSFAEVGELGVGSLDATELGLEPAAVAALDGGDAPRNLALLNELLGGARGALHDALVLNSAAALVVAGLASTPVAGVELAREILSSGAAREKFSQWCSVAQQRAGGDS